MIIICTMILLVTSTTFLFLRYFMQRNLVKVTCMSQVGKGKKWFMSYIYGYNRSHMRCTVKAKIIHPLCSVLVFFFYHSITKQTANFYTFNEIGLANNYMQRFYFSIFFLLFWLKTVYRGWVNSFDAHSIFSPPV